MIGHSSQAVHPARQLSRVEIDAPMALWRVDLLCPPDPDTLVWLYAQEIDRAARFRHVRDRQRYLTAHVALRLVIARCSGLAPAAQRFEHSALGKWRLVNDASWHFNLSYAGDVALIGIARDHPIGVDIEALRPVESAAELVALHFNPSEHAAYAQSSTSGADAAFLRGWTRKEACLKALGTGLQLSPASLDTGLSGRRRVETTDGALDLDSFATDGFIAAWACCR